MKRITLTLPAPYVGLRPFTEDEALLFFGREAHVRDLLAGLQRQQRFTAVLGASGTGKSSLVRAGLIPALHRGALRPFASAEQVPPHRWNVCLFQPGDSPLANLAAALTEDPRWVHGTDRERAISSLAATLGSSPLALSDLYRQLAERFTDESLLLVVDQFEEIFRYRQRKPDAAESLIALLLRSASEAVPIYVVITMRSDFLGHCVAFNGLPEAINSGLYLTPRLGTEQIRSVISSPLTLVGGRIDPVLANRLVNALGGDDELPILQHALLRMWQRARSLGRSEIDDSDFRTLCAPRLDDANAGTASSAPLLSYAIDNHAWEIYGALTPAQREVCRQLFLALVERREGRELRRPQSLRQLRQLLPEHQHAALEAVIDAFRAADAGFLLPRGPRPIDTDELIDISHESLFRQWQLFRQWLREEERDVAELREWRQRAMRQQSEGGGWLDDNDCARAQRWRERVSARTRAANWARRYEGSGAYAQVDRYIQDSLDRLAEEKALDEALRQQAQDERTARLEAEAELQRAAAQRAEAERERALAFNAVLRRRSRLAIAGCLIALAFGALALLWWRQAEEAKLDAEAMARHALAGELASTAENLRREQPDQSLLVALAAREVATNAKADALLRTAQHSFPYTGVLRGHHGEVWAAQFSHDGKTLFTVSDDHRAKLWEVASGRQLHVLEGHTGAVGSAAFSPDDRLLITAGEDHTARLWDTATGQLHQVLRGHRGPVWSAQFSADGLIAITASDDLTARLWDVRSGRELLVLRGHGGPLWTAQLSPDSRSVVTASDDGSARLWDSRNGNTLHVLRGHQGAVWSARFSADGQLVLTASLDRTARVWEAASGRQRHVLRGHEHSVRSADFSPDGKTVLTASRDKTARLWDLSNGRQLRVLRGHEGPVWTIQASPDGRTLLTASRDKTARLWDAASGRELRVLRGHGSSVWSADFTADGTLLVTASGDQTARLWKTDDEREARVLQGHHGPVSAAEVSADGRRLLTASDDNTARLWRIGSAPAAEHVLAGHEAPIVDARFAADGGRVITASLDGTARVWDVTSGEQRLLLRGHEGAVLSARFAVDGSLVTTGKDQTVRFWDAANGRQLRVVSGHEAPVVSAELAADHKTMLTASSDKTARLWDADSGRERVVLRGHEAPVTGARFSPDGRLVLTTSWDATARLWDSATGRELHVLRGHEEAVRSARFSADGKTVLTASIDGTARLWDVNSGRERHVLRGHEDSIESARFSPDGKIVLTAGSDHTARLWDAGSGDELAVLRGHEGEVWSTAFTPDGQTIVTTANDRTVRLWRCGECRPITEIVDDVSRRVGRPLSESERRRFGLVDTLPRRN